MEPERKEELSLAANSNGSTSSADDNKSDSAQANYSNESAAATGEPAAKGYTASPGLISSQIGESDEDGFDEADGESDDQEQQTAPEVSTLKSSALLGMNEYEIRAQQLALAEEYAQLARLFSQALEKRVTLTLKKLNQLEAKEQREKKERKFHQPGSEQTKSKYSEESEVYQLGKRFSYQMSSIRANSRNEALIIWRDFYRQKVDLREKMSRKKNQRISLLRYEHDHARTSQSTDIPVLDWISANLDTVHYLRTQQPLASLEQEDAESDIQLIRGKGIDSRHPLQLAPAAIVESDSEEEAGKIDDSLEVIDKEEHSVDEKEYNSMGPQLKKHNIDYLQHSDNVKTIDAIPLVALQNAASPNEVKPERASQDRSQQAGKKRPLSDVRHEYPANFSSSNKASRKSPGRKRASSGLSSKTEVSVLPSAMHPAQQWESEQESSGKPKPNSMTSPILPGVPRNQSHSLPNQASSRSPSQNDVAAEHNHSYTGHSNQPTMENRSHLLSEPSSGQPNGQSNGFQSVANTRVPNVSQSIPHIQQGSPLGTQQTPHGHIIGMPEAPQYMISHQQSPHQTYVPAQVMSPSNMQSQTNQQAIYASQMLPPGGYQYYPGYPMVQGYPQYQYVAQAQTMPAQQPSQAGYVYAFPEQWQGYVPTSTGSPIWPPHYAIPQQPR